MMLHFVIAVITKKQENEIFKKIQWPMNDKKEKEKGNLILNNDNAGFCPWNLRFLLLQFLFEKDL